MTALTSAERELLRPYVPEMLLRWPADEPFRVLTGTLVSADISGFTALSEQLAARGREGAEELTILINSCFDGMIEDCYLEGGDVLKFGGDALLVFFDGDRHVERAARASIAMRRTIGHPRRTSENKRVRLAVSIGVHAGEHTFFLVRNGHRELLVTGSGITATVDAESAARAGDVLLSAPTAARLPASWLGAVTPDGVLLRRTFGSPAPRDGSPITGSAEDFIPPEQREQIVAGALNEHRQVSIAFLEFSRTDGLDAEALSSRLQMLATNVWATCERYGIFWLTSDVYHDGGKFILTAGAPISRGGDEDRMLRAIREIVDADPGLNLCAGVNRGYVFAGDLGSARRRTYTIMGDATNLAARLMAKANAGEIVASRQMIDWASSNIEYEPLEPFLVKGKSLPIHAGKLGKVLGRRSDLDRVDTELCGRADELRLLLQRADDARSGRGSVTIITGEPGIGKSRLALEVVRQRADMPMVFARCQPYDRLAAYSVAQPLLRALLRIGADLDERGAGQALIAWLERHSPHLVTFAPLIAVAFGAEAATTAQTAAISVEFRRTRTLQLVIEIIRIATKQPTAVLVDDINLADDASRELIAALTESAVDIPLFVVATSIPDDELAADPLHLGALDASDVTRLLDVLLGDHAVAADVVRSIVDRSAGNPLFVGELVRTLVEDPSAAIPPTLEALVASRVDSLEPIDRQLLRQASVLGTEVDISLLGLVTDDRLIRRQDLWERLSRFLEWAAPGVVRFRYDTYWRVVYGGLSYTSRRIAHRKVIEIIESTMDPNDTTTATLLAAHAERASDHERTWRYSIAAADCAATTAMFGEAARLFTMALGASPKSRGPAELAEVNERAGDTFERAARYDDAVRCFRRTLRIESDPVRRGRLLRKIGEVAERQGAYALAARQYSSAERELATTDWITGLREQIQLTRAQAGLAFRQARYNDAWRLAAASVTQATVFGEWQLAAVAAMTLDNVITPIRWRDPTVERPDVLALYRRAGDHLGEGVFKNNLAVDAYFDGDWTLAAELYRESAKACAAAGHVVGEATALNNIAEILSDQGRYADAAELLHTASRNWRAVGFATGIALAEANLGRLATRTGDHEAAERSLTSSLSRFERLGAEAFVDEVRLRLFENRLYGTADPPHDDVAMTTTMLDNVNLDVNLRVYAHRLLAISSAFTERDAALRYIGESIDAARAAGIPYELAQSLWIAAGLRLDGVAGLQAEATTTFDGLGVLSRPRLVRHNVRA